MKTNDPTVRKRMKWIGMILLAVVAALGFSYLYTRGVSPVWAAVAIVCFSVMGMSMDDVGSPQFLISLIVEVGLMLLSLLIYFIWKLKSKRKRDDETNEA